MLYLKVERHQLRLPYINASLEVGGNLLRHTVRHQEICAIFMLIKDVSSWLLMGSCKSGLKLQYNMERKCR